MAWITGSYLGTKTAMEDVYIDSAPRFYFGGSVMNNPDATTGLYWGLSGSASNPVYEVGCYEGFKFADNVTTKDITCDKVGLVGTTQKRNHIEINFTLKSFFPLDVLAKILRIGTPTTVGAQHFQAAGIGDITNKNTYYPCYWERTYDEDNGDFFAFHGHKCQFVDAWDIGMGVDTWTVGVKVKVVADTTKPAGQKFGTIIRYDPSVL